MFKNIIGHKNIISFLEKSIKNDEVSHAYLFYGPKHLGKRTVAEKFVEALLGQSIANHPDVYLVEREKREKEEKLSKNISIEQMRELERKLSLSSFLNSYKIGIIEEAETLSQEAANSLLKTLEEPTAKTVIFLLSSNVSALPATIVSRCQVLKFLPVSQNKIYEHLVNLGAKRDTALNLAKISWGKPGRALNFWKSQNEKERASDLKDYQEKMDSLIRLMDANLFSKRMKVVETFFSEGKDSDDLISALNKVLLLWSSLLRDAVLVKNGCEDLIFNVAPLEKLKEIAGSFNNETFFKLHREIKLSSQYLKENFNSRLVLENLVLSF